MHLIIAAQIVKKFHAFHKMQRVIMFPTSHDRILLCASWAQHIPALQTNVYILFAFPSVGETL
jgi:hypothetical protein